MLVRVLEERVPYVGVRGDTKEMKERDARILIKLGKVEQVVDAPAPIEQGGYSRRDMRPEQAPKAPKKARVRTKRAEQEPEQPAD